MIRVLVVDDSAICRAMIAEVLEAEGDMQVVAEAASAREACDRVRDTALDLVTMDVALAGESGLDAIRWIMSHRPSPVLVVTERPAEPGTALAFEAIASGALDIVAKSDFGDQAATPRLRAIARELARVRVIRHLAPDFYGTKPVSHEPTVSEPGELPVVAIGASAGGPGSIARVLCDLPAWLPAAIAVVQHLPPGFSADFCSFLANATQRRVVRVTASTKLARGVVHVAPDEAHLVIDGASATVSEAKARGGHRPSIDVCLASLAARGSRAIGVLLTGIGDDGVDGLDSMRKHGALTIAQDRATAAVYGIPRAAAERGAASEVLALDRIGARVAEWAEVTWTR